MENSNCGYPYKGAKEHYILDIDDELLSKNVVMELIQVIPVKIKKERKSKAKILK